MNGCHRSTVLLRKKAVPTTDRVVDIRSPSLKSDATSAGEMWLHGRKFSFAAGLCWVVQWTLLDSAFASAPPPSLMLSQAIEIARSVNPELRTLLAERDSTLAKERQARAPAEPLFDFGIGDLAAGPESSGLRTYQLTQALGFPGKAAAAARSLELDAASLDQRIRAKELEITRLVKTVFYQLALEQEKLDLNTQRHASFERILAVGRRRFVKDTTTEVEFLNTQATLKRIDNERQDLITGLKSSRVALDLLLASPPGTPIEIVIPAPPKKLPAFDDAEAQAIRGKFALSNPLLRDFQFETQAAQNRVTEARRAYLPDFKFSGGTNNLHAYAGIIEVTVPIWFWWNEKSGVAAAAATAAAKEADVALRRNTLLTTLEGKLASLQALGKKLGNYQSTLIPDSRRAFEVALRNYRFGKVDFPTLIASAEAEASSRLEYDTLLTEYRTLEAELEEMLGGSIS